MTSPTVSIIQRRLTHYRVPFFVALRESLAEAGIKLRLFHGQGTSQETAKADEGYTSWAEPLETRYLAGERLCWQPFAKQVTGSALVIVTQENALLANHLALIKRPAPKLAFWGHGANFQGNSQSMRERYKRWSTGRVDWYFGYTRKSVELVKAAGFEETRITQLDNAVDTEALKRDLAAIKTSDIDKLRMHFTLEPGPTALFLGSLYAHKRLDFLIAAAVELRAQIPGFQLLIAGDGPQRAKIESAASKYHWIHHCGALKGMDKACVMRLAKINMNPGLVGLGLLDSFAAALPLVTTDCGLHSPEIAYLDTSNGVISPDNLEAYVAACKSLLTDDNAHRQLANGCRIATERYTLSNMVQNFTNGVVQALELPR
jgi:glycosyltransferase involved in cell wall biosynthesis